MQQASSKKIIASSSGTDAKGAPIITPDSILSFVDQDNEVCQSLAADAICYMSNALWDHSLKGITIRTQLVFDMVPFHPALIRHWLKNAHTQKAALMFPRDHRENELRDPIVRLSKNISNPAVRVDATSLKVDIVLQVFRRDLNAATPTMQPFDAKIWRPESYGTWVYMYREMAPILEEECAAKKSTRLPENACNAFRCMMHAHFNDFGYIFGKLWFGFGLKDMVAHPDDFMRNMLFKMFRTYHDTRDSHVLQNLPPLFNAVTMASGQRICAKCLTSKLGSGQMMRCPCHQVYYCSAACQKADWKVHKLMCDSLKK